MARTEHDGAIEDPTIPSRRRQLPTRSMGGDLGSNPSLPRQSLVITSTTASSVGRRKGNNHYATILALMALVSFWFVCFVLLMAKSGDIHPGTSSVSGVYAVMKSYRPGLRKERLNQAIEQQQNEKQHGVVVTHNRSSPQIITKPHLVSRVPNKIVATADVRGNLGPASVVIQAKPGTNWIRDRWQAASNMHGKQILGEHWIQLEFEDTTVVADKIVLDWETAYADEYILQASSEAISEFKVSNSNNPPEGAWILFDGRNQQDVATMRSVTESGKSPGVDEPRPLHVVHEIQLSNSHNSDTLRHKPFRFLRLHILKSVTGWGVSLWQFDVYGFRTGELETSR